MLMLGIKNDQGHVILRHFSAFFYFFFLVKHLSLNVFKLFKIVFLSSFLYSSKITSIFYGK